MELTELIKNRTIEMNDNITDEIKNLILEDSLKNLTGIKKNEFNLPMNIFICNDGIDSDYGVRVIVQNNYVDYLICKKSFIIMLDENLSVIGNTWRITEEDILIIKDFINDNRDIITDVWCSFTTIIEMYNDITDN